MMTLRTSLTAAVMGIALVTATPAWANSVDLGTIQPGTTSGHVFSHGKGSFTDTITFLIGTGGTASSQYFNFLVVGSKGDLRSNIKDAVLSLTGPSTYTTPLKHNESYEFLLSPGWYTATITGVANGALGGAYAVQVAAPTPEPEAIGMIAIGVGMAGSYVARRRRRKAAIAAA